ncbi:hypothetical protein E6C27_scaffold403G00440 [Cucumis melo var. makuwa]|uniref:Uncharacterized protein n=1 Tax=Cucumis melo var. makuwa TaxID=1194695 RepID=A0A5A7T0M9_CUCMM|nr:hypothetical protein E6C27_scaffold403G00440 [Cucumis melo var. makuwa]
MKTLIETPRQNRFFIEKRFHEFCYWVRKTRNRNGYIAEVFSIDQQGRKCCVLVPEGEATSGWVFFLSMVNPNVKTEPKARPPLEHFYKKGKSIASADSDSDSSRKSCARVVSEGYSSDSTSCSESKNQRSVKTLPLENAVVITRRLFHDDWKVIMNSLKKQTKTSFTYNPFHAEKALIIFSEHQNAKSLCSNTRWTTISKFQVKFEFWSIEKHAGQKLIPSYGGWMSFRGIPIHTWNIDTFLQIGNSSEGLLEVEKATMNMDNLIEAKIKVRYNYSGFILATIRIKDKDVHFFVVHTVTICSGKWLAKRDVKIHGSFKRQVAIEFDKFNSKAEQFNFTGDLAISPGKFKITRNMVLMTELTNEEDPTITKKIYDGDLPKSSKKNSKRLKLVERWMEKRAVITSSNDEESFNHEHSFEGINVADNESLRLGGKRKEEYITDFSTDVVKETQDSTTKKVTTQNNNSTDFEGRGVQTLPTEVVMVYKEEEDAFKAKLIQGLKENNLKLAASLMDPLQQQTSAIRTSPLDSYSSLWPSEKKIEKCLMVGAQQHLL